jgi:adenosine deaminase
MEEARRDGLYFTPCAWTSLVKNRPLRPQRIKRMVEAGLNVTINTDDPAMFGTSLGHGFTTLFEAIGWGPDMARKLCLNSVEGSWLDESDKSVLRMAFRKDIAALDREFGYATTAPTV